MDNDTAQTEPVVALKPVQEDISRKTVVMLLILVVILSALGTWSVFNEISKFNQEQVVIETPGNQAQGEVRFTIVKPAPTPRTIATGMVSFGVLNKEE